MINLKVGEIVKIKPKNEINNKNMIRGQPMFSVLNMEEFCDKLVTVSYVGSSFFKIKEDFGTWYWGTWMLNKDDINDCQISIE